jgi:hypothetical protein
MTRYLKLAAVCAFVFAAQSAAADTTAYEFTAKNNSAASMTITVDGKASCTIDAGQSCRLNFKREDATLAYSLAGAAPVTFTTGNIEAADVCNIDASGAHCVDTMGQPTN